MYIYYHQKTDYLEVFKKEGNNYGHLMDDGIFEMRSTQTEEVIGYGLENISKHIDKLDMFEPSVRTAIIHKIQGANKDTHLECTTNP